MIDESQLNRLYRYALSLCAESDVAYDLVHGAIGRFIEPPVPELQDPMPYLMRSVRNAFIDQQRHRQRYSHQAFEEEQVLQDFHLKVLESLVIDEHLLEQLLEMLSAEEGEILYLWAVEGYSTQEVADLLEMPKGSLLSKIHRLRKRLLASEWVRESAQGEGGRYA
ncbi:sigma-70 family RNA polymerase sigma factor [Pseudoteredinibacter isoporae]|uniref:RNA polymerase sigma-70 factor (ECF subfamily) n=1 Tax=Pseudoteredinibacter isoporae TaxID=570281 RepID=A0A7X0JT41_9GAMM|nr:RNA polymerase sigma-70 factor (ECF subfamily) [Pseudoteredinibacter isoporae]NHO87200.1 RNA polymerase sigma factor [Pseudoteredinibacter isoporae]NIB23024.1 RNA polymerase sigma factor [Pseudoteredinibacter isoporae]